VITGGLPATVNRSANLPLAWTGGNSSDVVQIMGGSSTSTDTWNFICSTTAGAGGFTISNAVLGLLPASNNGILSVSDSPAAASLTAPLVAGGSIDLGQLTALLSIGATVSYQ